jgi:hypothetical protein
MNLVGWWRRRGLVDGKRTPCPDDQQRAGQEQDACERYRQLAAAQKDHQLKREPEAGQ